MPDADPNRIIHCIKLKQDLPGLVRAPFPTEFGQFIFENVSKDAWDQWLAESVRFINTYQWDLATRAGTDALIKQLRIWLGLEDGELLQTAWTPPQE